MAELPATSTKGQTVTINYERPVKLTVLTPTIIRFFEDHGEPGESYAIEGDKQQETSFTFENCGDHFELKTNKVTVKLDADRHIEFDDAKGNVLATSYHGERKLLDFGMDEAHKTLASWEGHAADGNTVGSDNRYYELRFALAHDEHFYGLGDKTGYMDKRGYEYDNWNTDNPNPHLETTTRLYKSIPILYGMRNGHPYGLFFDNPYRSHLDLGRENRNYYFYAAVDGNIDFYLIGGDSLKDVVTNYTYLTGRTPLPQRWMLGYQQSRWGYSRSAEEVEGIVDGFKKHNLPLDAIHFDIDYMEGYRVFTFDKKKFHGDPQKFIADLKKRGVRVVCIIDPGVKKDPAYKVYQEGIKKGYFVKNPDGSVYENKVWPGTSVFPDFGRKEVREWWAKNDHFLTKLGVSGIWNDMNEPASFEGEIPDNIVFTDGDHASTHKKMHNVYGHNMAKATYQGIKESTGKRPYVITRAAYAGTQKYSTVWTGDNQSLWPHLQLSIPQLCNLEMSGFDFSGVDLGGFGADSHPQLMTRWIEAGIFSPLLRNHSSMGTRYQEPWAFGEPTLLIYRKYLNLRYHFIPYLYDLFAQESQNGLPIMRSLLLNNEDDPNTYDINDEYMVGDKVLVAPIVRQDEYKRLVYLPAGQWIDFWNGREYDGKQTIVADAPLDKLPLYIKKGSLLPWGQLVSHLSDEPDKQMTFQLYGPAGECDHYQDNGTDFKYQDGEYNLYHVAVTADDQVSVDFKHQGYAPIYERIVVKTDNAKHVLVYDANSQKYVEE